MAATSSLALKVAVIGGGVIGLACARALALRGAEVALYERDTPGRAASWVAGGMLAATLESGESVDGLQAMLHESLARWDDYAAALEAESGVSISLRREGLLRVGDDLAALREEQEKLSGRGRLEWLDGEALRRLEPHLRGAGALFAPDDHHVDNRRLVIALAQACVAAGVAIHEYASVDEVLIRGGRAVGVSVDGQVMPADAVVVAAGAWAAALGLAPFAHIVPVKGQILALQMDPLAPVLRHVVWGSGVYLIPRNDGRLIVGASVEPEAGFDAGLDPAVMKGLRAGAARIIPLTEHLPVVGEWSGFRPGPAHHLPVIGKTDIPGLFGAAGLYRNGILLTPLTGELVARAVFA